MASADVLPPSPGGGAIDVSRLSNFLSLPEDVISSFASITEEYVTSVLRAIDERSREHDSLRADTLRIEVELEQAVRTADNRVKAMKTQLDSSLAETQDLRSKLNTSETARSSLETELINFKSSRTDVNEEVRVLKIRVQSLESDKRDTLEALDRKSNDYDRLQDEYEVAQSKAIETRREASSLETQLQQAQSAQTSAKFREQNLAQEVDLLKKNNEWLDSELKTKVAEFQKFRKEKAAQVSILQRELDDALTSVDSTQRNMDNLKTRFDEVSKKAQDALAKIQELQNQALQREESFGNEMNSQQRLAELFEKSARSAKTRVAELELLLEREHERESVEVGRARAQAETEHAEREAAESRVAELEVQVERLESEISTYATGGFVLGNNDLGSPRGSINGNSTPRRRPGSAMGTPGGISFGSPAATRLQKSGLSITQLYSDYTAMKANFETEKRRNAKLEEAINDLVADLEHKAPELEELREEHTRLQKELVDMSLMCEENAKEKEKAKKDTRRLEVRIGEYERESTVLRQQLRDLSNQVQVLLVEIEHRDSGANPLSIAQNRTFQQIVNGEISEDYQTDTDRLISQRLTVFRSVREMQEQNEHLLKAIRDLGDKMEKEEQTRKDEEAGKEGKEIVLLKSVVERLKDELKTLGTKAQSFIRERDMFRRMLQNKGDIPRQEDDEARSQVAESDAGSAVPPVNLAEVIRDLQSQYDQFKTEALENHNTLNEQTRRLAAEKSELSMQYARANSQLELATERYEMLNGNFNMLKDENDQLRQRLSGMHENHAKQDLRTQQVAEELVDCKSLIEGMRTENANLNAEKTLWKNIEQRLAQDNEALTQERGRLNGLISNLQSIQSERERADSETRRRLMNQNEKIENELQQTKRRLNEEVEEAKKLVIRKEIDARESQKKIDELNATLAATRENMVAAKTSQDHLQARVNELSIELKAAEERLQVYQPKPNSTAPAPAEEGEDEEMADREQELQIEITELHRTLEFTKEELESVKTQVEQYKEIAQGSEEELHSMNESHDAYRESMEQEITEHEAKIKDLEQRLEVTVTDLATANQELAQFQQREVEQSREFENERKILQAQIDGLKEDIEKNAAAVTFYQEDLRSQARIAQEAQQNYERELVKHAEAAKALQQVREEYANLKTEVHQIKSEAESAKATLSSSEMSWEAQKDNYEKELGEVKMRCNDLMKQNKILLGQLDNVSEQVSTLQKSRAAVDEMDESGEHDAADRNIEDLREVIKYLRREKEIVDVQYELCLQESKRLKQQLDYSRATVDETRLLLAQERQREADQLRGVTQHKELMEKISELNLLRESNSALRSDGERKGKKVEELQAKAIEMQAKIEPLEDQVRNLEEEREQKDKEIKLLTEHGERWQARAQQILNKYDRIDPAELESLKEQVEQLQEQAKQLQGQYDSVVVERNSLQVAVQESEKVKELELNGAAEKWRVKLKKLVDDTKGRLREAKTRMVEVETELETAKTQLDQANKSVEALKERIVLLEAECAKANQMTEAQKSNAASFHREVRSLKDQLTKSQAEISDLRATSVASVTEAVAPVAPITPAVQFDEVYIEAEVARRVAAIPPPDITAAVQAEVSKRMSQIGLGDNSAAIEAVVAERIAQIPPPDNTAAIEAEVARRMAAIPSTSDNAAAIEAEVQRRMALIPPTDNSAAIETEISRRLAEIEASRPGQEVGEIAESAPVVDIEAIVESRVAEERKRTQARIDQARQGFQEYKAAAVAKALEQKEAEVHQERAAQGEAHKKQLAEMQEIIDELRKEIESLKKQLEDTQAEAEKAKTEIANLPSQEEELKRALEAKEQEHQEAIEALRREEAAKLEEVTHQLQADFLARSTEADSTKKPPTKEELTAIIKKNVEHRLTKEKAKWEQHIEAERKQLIEDGVNEVIEEKLKEKKAEMQAEMAASLEKSKDALRQEGMARIKVQLNMLEKKNKGLEEKVKAYEAGGTPMPGQQIPVPSGIKPPGQSAIPQPPLVAQQQQPGQEIGQIIPPSSAQRRDAVGTGPATLRSLRGSLASNIPRGGRGGGQPGRPPSQAGSHGGSPTQLQPPQQFPPGQQMNLQGQQPPQFGSRMSLPGGHQQSQLPRGGTMIGRGQFQHRGQGRGQGQMQGQQMLQQQQQMPNIQTGLPMQGQQGQAQSPGRVMNPGARQFVPVKRLRDDGIEADDGGAQTHGATAGKRPKGHNG